MTWFLIWTAAIIGVPWALTEATSHIAFRLPWSQERGQ